MSDDALKIGGGAAGIGLGAIGVCCCIGILIFIICLPFAIQTVRYDEYGIKYYSLTTAVDQEIYEPGRYWVHPGYWFITIPRTFQTVEFSSESVDRFTADGGPLTSRTQDGLSVSLDISFQFLIFRKNVYSVFDKFATNYKNIIIQFARDTLRDAAAKFNAFQFFSNRTYIGDYMESELKKSIARINITVEYFQLRKVDLPDAYENIIEENQIQIQKIPKAQFDQQTAVVKAETDILISKKQADIVKIRADVNADTLRITARANANRTLSEVKAFSSAYNNIKAGLGLSNDDLMTYIWVDTVRELQSDKLLVNLEKPESLTFN